MDRRMSDGSVPTFFGGLGRRLTFWVGDGFGDGGYAPFGESSVFVHLNSPCRGRAGRHYFNREQDMTSKPKPKQDMTF